MAQLFGGQVSDGERNKPRLEIQFLSKDNKLFKVVFYGMPYDFWVIFNARNILSIENRGSGMWSGKKNITVGMQSTDGVIDDVFSCDAVNIEYVGESKQGESKGSV
jgi:hypothetical protein